MKKTNIALFIVAGLLAIANLLQGQELSYEYSYFPNGTVAAVSTYHDSARVERRVFYPTGEVWMIADFDPESGLQHGDEFWYWRNGEVKEATEYVNGYAHGYCFGWDPSGETTFTKLYFESREVPVEDYDKYFPSDEYQDEPDPSAFALRAKGQ